jgi:nicotinamidase/pyrazinamidase
VQRYDSRTSLIIVDLQNDFADPAGSLSVKGGADIIPTINCEVDTATAAGSVVVFTQDWHPESTPHFAKDGGIWPVHCVGGTWGAELHPDVAVPADAVRLRKGANGEDGYSGFTMRDPESGDTIPTPLEPLLRERGVERIVVCGLATDHCVLATALDAARRGLDTALLEDAVAAVNLQPRDGERAVRLMRRSGIHIWQTGES